MSQLPDCTCHVAEDWSSQKNRYFEIEIRSFSLVQSVAKGNLKPMSWVLDVMLFFCVRVSCEEKILYGPKWISIEESSTLCDVLRCATGNKYLSRKLKVVVASEKSLKDLSFVKLCLPVLILDRNDKKIVSFLLKPKDAVITVRLYIFFLWCLYRFAMYGITNSSSKQGFIKPIVFTVLWINRVFSTIHPVHCSLATT